jgi:hypothetical protein
MQFEDKQTQLEDIMLSEVSQAQIKATCFLSYVGERHNPNTSKGWS